MDLLNTTKEGLEMYNPVVSNEYEVALHIIKGMLRKGLITRKEFDKIEAENKRSFIEAISAK